jgi:hypothetical protein
VQKAITYRKFQDFQQAKELIDLLIEHSIYYELEDNSPAAPELFIGKVLDPVAWVKICPKDFIAVTQLLENNASISLNEIDEDHYLFSFSTTELYELISEPDKWSALDYQLAKKILGSRGETINEGFTNALKEMRLKELHKKEKGSAIWTTLGYILAALGGILGMAIGLHLWLAKKTLPNGTRTYTYTETDRKHGQAIFIIGVGIALFSLYLRIKHSIW